MYAELRKVRTNNETKTENAMIIKPARRTESVQEYYFSRKLKEIDRMNAERDAAGEERIINLGIGAPDPGKSES